jgi:ATP-dependent DNA helicase DinG
MTELVGPDDGGTEKTSKLVTNRTPTFNDYLSAFPFQDTRPNQHLVLQDICEAFNSGYKVIVLEAPTGFGKSPVAMCVARTLGSSYICSATKDLQAQYVADFPFLKSVKGMNNFTCYVREDFALSDNYRCNECGSPIGYGGCRHKSVSYGPCRNKGNKEYAHSRRGCVRCNYPDSSKFHSGCRYRTHIEDYSVLDRNTLTETVLIDGSRLDQYQNWYKSSWKINHAGNIGYIWKHLENLEKNGIRIRDKFIPCPYYDQLNIGLAASHTILNYANFLIFSHMRALPKRELLILDEGHQIESQIVEHIGFIITRKTLQKYALTSALDDLTLDYTSHMEQWLKFLNNLYYLLLESLPTLRSEEVRIDAEDYLEELGQVINEITLKPDNWIVSNFEHGGDSRKETRKQLWLMMDSSYSQDDFYREEIADDNKIIKIEFKPLDVSLYCKKLFEKCSRTLIMSATILDIDAFCRNVGLDRDNVKFIQVDSDFLFENRPIYQLDITHLNYKSVRLETTQKAIANSIDRIMSVHKNDKGIIHTTSYEQVRFIDKYISTDNRIRLIFTDPEKLREQVTSEHFISRRPTVLISPSLHTGLDLKDDRSRFQILVKVPYPNKGDRWINAKMRIDPDWYNWQTKLRLVQAYGRSVRSKDDWAKTYVLDSSFGDFVRKNRLPDWFTEAIKADKTV